MHQRSAAQKMARMVARRTATGGRTRLAGSTVETQGNSQPAVVGAPLSGGGGRAASGAIAPMAVTCLLRELARTPEQAGDRPPAFHPGQRVGRFELLREIGRGGCGVVYEARDLELERTVAFKVVRGGGKIHLREKLLFHEAKAAARLSHANVVTLFDVGRCEDGPYLVLELLRGRALAAHLKQGALPLREALWIGVEVSKGLAHAHAQGVIHRDLKPGNVFLCDDGQVKILDFGLAQAFGLRRVDGGTRAYMAPEQRRKAPQDERTDVFALGVLLYQMLTGGLPFPADRDALPGSRRAPGFASTEPALEELIGKMLEADPVKRPRDAGKILSALTAFEQRLQWKSMAGAPVTARRLGASSLRPHRLLNELDHERLGACVAAIDSAAIADEVVGHLPRGHACAMV